MRILIRHATLLLALALASAAPSPGEPRFTVTSRSQATVTVDGGRADGLSVGDRLRVVRGGATIAELEIVSAAERWSSCRVLSSTRPIATGDVVVPADRPPAARPRASRRRRPRRSPRRRRPSLPPPPAAPSTAPRRPRPSRRAPRSST